MKLYTGTSGFSYKEWIGNFYPEKTRPAAMLEYYSSKLGVVEINNTFYRMPKKEIVEKWDRETPEGFLFSIKASRKITHIKRLKDVDDETGFMLDNISILGPKLGAVLFQFPPYFKKNAERLEEFLKILPQGLPAVFEFRDDSWYDDEISGLLSARKFIFCFSDVDEKDTPAIINTAGWGYLRLRRQDYSPDGLKEWADRIRSQDWDRALVFFKHEGEGIGPRTAIEFAGLFAAPATVHIGAA
jgi:uncharacterized protein YecE (DUF72 family)